MNRSKGTTSNREKSTVKEIDESNRETPIEAINSSLDAINTELADTLLEEILKKDAYFFEDLVVQLLQKMGYGKIDQSTVTKRSGDEGIDGMISSDRLGLDTIYIQAKRYAIGNPISNAQIRDFSGALLQKGATKGVFITTSDFSEQAIKAVGENRHQTIALINGYQLTALMIEYNLGVSIERTIHLKRLDSDYFNDDF